MRKIKRAMRKKAATGITIGLACLLFAPPAALAGEIRFYNGYDPLQTIDTLTDSFGPANLTNISGNAITINYFLGPTPKYVFGGYSSSGNVTDNTVIINYGTVGFSVFGGYSGSGNATNNTVTINGGSVTSSVLGAYSISGNAISNTVTISGGNVGGDIYGGESHSGNARGNTIIINSGTVSGNVLGGLSTFDSATGNTITISGGSVTGRVFGGYSNFGNATGNTITISGGILDDNVVGGSSSTSSATGNTVIISSGNVGGNVLGGLSDSGSATGNTVTISGNPILNGILYGGYTYSGGGDIRTGNTLNVKNSGMSAKGVANFQYYNFYFPSTLASGDTMLNVTNAANISGATIGIRFLGDTSLQSGNTVTLLRSAGTINATGINTTAHSFGGVATVYDFALALSPDSKSLYATYSGARQNAQVKALSEGQVSSAAFLNQGADMLTGQGLQNARSASSGAGGQTSGFAALGGSSLRYETGSHVDVNGVSFVAGAAKETPTAQGALTSGLFLEHGRGSYSTYNSFNNATSVKGDGDTQYFGVGVLAHQQKSNGQYLEGSLRTGRISNQFNSGDIGTAGTTSAFDVSAPYYGLHIGLGRETDLGKNKKQDTYAKLLWTRQDGSSATVQGDEFRFAAVDSLRGQTGTKWLFKTNQNTTLRAGLAYQYEFDGQSDATVNGSAIESPSMKGGAGILEIGLTREGKDGKEPTLDIGLQGFCGKIRGVAGTVQASWKF